MNQDSFVVQHDARWKKLDAMLTGKLAGTDVDGFPQLYRAVCNDLAMARQRRFDAHVVDRLNDLVIRGHQLLYRPRRGSWRRIFDFLSRDFPRAVRSEWRLVTLMHVLFYGPAVAVAALLLLDPDMVFAVLDPEQAHQMEKMYDPSAEHYLRPRSFDNDAAMFGFYIYNNISIAFRTFASGIFAGIGSLFFVIYNGVLLGAVAAHLNNVGFGMQLGQFVIGHGSTELTAIVLSGAAGMRLGWSLIAPGQWTRVEALRQAAQKAMPLVYGSLIMLVVAASIEAFWSSSVNLEQSLKLWVGGAGWLLVYLYLVVAGRVGRGSRAR